jgi:stage II sporulation protein GA (sporulation sigma-E factor processing peptidase)
MPNASYIYADVYYLINFLMDYTALWATARFARFRVRFWRLLLAASVGACYGVLILFPSGKALQTFFFKFLTSVLMVALVFAPVSWKRFSQMLLYFYLVSFTMGGAVLGLSNLVSNLPTTALEYLSFPYFWLGAAAATAFVLGKWGIVFVQKSFLQGLLHVPVKIKIQGKEINVAGLIDTGNQLTDPLTGNPVIIVEYKVLAPLLPDELQKVFTEKGEVDLEQLVAGVRKDETNFPFRLIPFTTIGKHHGIMIGFKPDEVSILAGEETLKTSRVVVGIYNKRLSPKGDYRALLHPDLLYTSVA